MVTVWALNKMEKENTKEVKAVTRNQEVSFVSTSPIVETNRI